MMREFLLAVGESENKPDRIEAAVACLDLSGLDPAVAAEEGPRLAAQLEEIIEQIIQEQGLALESIPEQPAAERYRFGNEQRYVEVARQDDGRWRFTAETVAAVPQMHRELRKAAAAKTEQAPPDVPPEYRSPRATMKTFLDAANASKWGKAAACLDLSEQPAATREEIGRDLAEKLKSVMDRIAFVVYPTIPNEPLGPPYRWHVAAAGRIVVNRQEHGDRAGQWLFTAETLRSIEALYKAYEDKPLVAGLRGMSFWDSPRLWLRDRIPPFLKQKLVLLEHWQWLGVAIVLLAGWLVDRIFTFVLGVFTHRRLRAEHLELEKDIQRSAFRPLGVLAMVITWRGGLQVLDLGIRATEVLSPAIKFLLTIIAVWAAYRLIDLVSGYFAARARRTVSKLDDVLVPLVRKTVKIVIVAIGFAYVLKALGVGPDTINKVFAGLGLGGLAFALAAQDTLKNFFGSVTVILDRPFQVGDWVKIGDKEGTVESVGLRSSRIRTFYNSQVTIPNSEVMNTTVDNMGRRRYRRISCKLAVTYSTTPEQLEAFCEGIRELIRRHPYTRKDYYVVWVNEFADSSINILLYCFHETPDWVTELRERHRLFLDIIRLANRLGISFAFPTQTIHLARDGEPEARPAAPAAALPEPSKTTNDKAMTLGREQASQIVKEQLGDSAEIPPAFEFPKV